MFKTKYAYEYQKKRFVFDRKQDAIKAATAAGLDWRFEVYPFDAPSDRFIELMRYYYRLYLRSEGETVYTVYGRCSDKKRDAFESWKRKADNNDCRVLSHNCNFFTVGLMKEGLFTVATGKSVKEIPLRYLEG